MLPSEKLERFILGFGLEISANGAGRPTTLPVLLLAAREKCGDCKMEELVDALYNLGDDHVELLKFVPSGLRVRFTKYRNHPRWRDFFNSSFNIKVLPKGRVRFEKLSEQDDHTFPRRAIDEARKSISEPDGKPTQRSVRLSLRTGELLPPDIGENVLPITLNTSPWRKSFLRKWRRVPLCTLPWSRNA